MFVFLNVVFLCFFHFFPTHMKKETRPKFWHQTQRLLTIPKISSFWRTKKEETVTNLLNTD